MTTDDTDASGGKMFTQEDVNKMLAAEKHRILREEAPPERDELRKLRSELEQRRDYDELKAKADKLDEIEAANQSEMEKALARAEAAEKKATEADERARKSNLRSAVTAAASGAGAVDIDAVFALLPQDAVTFGDDGQVTGAEDAVRALLESKPYLVGKTPVPQGVVDGGPRGTSDGPKQISRGDLASMTPEAINAARLAGQLDDVMAGR